MKLTKPVYTLIPKEERILEFRGYNKKTVIDDGEMRDMYNLSSDEYPCLYQRKPRGVFSEFYQEPTAMLVKDKKLAVISDGKFYYDGIVYPQLVLSPDTHMVAINTRICFFPEKKYFNVKTKEVGSLAETSSAANITLTVSNSTITFPGEMQLAEKFNVGDAVTVSASGTGAEGLNVSAVIEKITGTDIAFPDETFIQVTGEGVESISVTVESISIERKCPDLDFVMEAGNRLWGVSNKDNTIYACKLGDPTNWAYFQNTALDSYYAEQGTDGEWTGCAPYSSHLLFFKEDYIHKVIGSKPSSYQITTAKCHALEKGSDKSIAIINETVLYKSRLGIMAYTGGVPQLISENFGTDKFSEVVAGTDGIKYYASALRNGEPELLVYDFEKGLWHKEDDIRAREFCYFDGKLLFINDNNGAIVEINSDKPLASEENIKWVAELGPFDEYIENKKVYSRIKMRLTLAEGSELTISISIDGGGWEKLQLISTEHSRSHFVPIVPRRCDKFAVKLEGKGYCRIESLVREYRQGTHRKDVR